MGDGKGKDGGWMRGKGKRKDSETNGARDAPWTEIVTKPTQRTNTYAFRSKFSLALVGAGVPVKGASRYPGVIITTCTSHLYTVECVARLLFYSTRFVPLIHSLIECSSEGQPAHTASGEDGTTGKDRLAKTP
ncbi:hypothetical protein M9H77_23633 [Catharanthus roseus]|uniref:Uncharacterized protein n=1 Tax=Catharanthus roseus TaxID=4058 RepID=A0ACC0AVL4_CATRO|nr:hypothetical protein M9H77_23633 [Catharanthus roseus]